MVTTLAMTLQHNQITPLTRVIGVFFKLFFGMLLLLPGISLAAELTSTVDRTQLGQDETLRLTVRYDGQAFSEPDFSALDKDFQILGRNQQSQLSFNNGQRESYTLWILQLMPKHTGKLLIPSFNYKKGVSNAIELEVTNQSTTPQSDQLVYLKTQVDKDSVYVQEQLIITHQLFSRVNLNGLANEDLVIDNATLTKLSENQYQKSINGVPHLVVETRYAVFPEASGTLLIPSVRYSVTLPEKRDPYASSFFSRGGKKVYLRSEQKELTVNPRPAQIPLNEWLPSNDISLSESWSRPLNELRVGEPITRTLTITAQGLTAVQLPPLDIPNGDGFRVYPDQPQLNDKNDSSGVIGTRTESLAIVPDSPGTITLPELSLAWWDSQSGQQRTTKIAQQTLNVLPAIGSNTSTIGLEPTATLPQQPEIAISDTIQIKGTPAATWLTTTLVLLNAILLALVIWLALKVRQLSRGKAAERSSPSNSADNEKQLFKTLQASASLLAKADTATFRRDLLNWAQVFWQDGALTTYEDIARKIDNPSLQKLLESLDKATYGATTEALDEDILKQIVLQLYDVRKNTAASSQSSGNNLKPLYET